MPLEGGLEVRFEPGPDGGTDFVPGDYWLIPGRSAGPMIDWPSDAGTPRPAAARRRAALVRRAGAARTGRHGRWSMVGGGDLRNVFSPLDQGFVTKGASGDTMRGPLAIQPVLQAVADNEDLAALRIDPHFDDNGKQGGRRDALVVSSGGIVFGTEETPSDLIVNGSASVLGATYARSLTVGNQVVVGASGPADVRVFGTLVVGHQRAPMALAGGRRHCRAGHRVGWRRQAGRGLPALR